MIINHTNNELLIKDNYQEIDNLLSKVKALECPSDYYQAKEDMLEVLLQIRKSIQDRECDFKRLMNQIINIFGQIIEVRSANHVLRLTLISMFIIDSNIC